jgi:tRNA modification GTPase
MAESVARNSQDATYASVLTPAGRGAVATVAVAGPAALQAVASCFEPLSRRPLQSYQPGEIVVGLFRGEAGVGEELVVGFIEPNLLEVHCHGGRAAVQAVLHALTRAGCTERGWQEHIVPQCPGQIEAEAWIALASATTERTAAILLDQTRGALRREIESVLKSLQTGDRHAARAKLQTLIDRGKSGLHLTQPWRIVIAGEPNVGKSSLINALVGYERSIVFDQPGTTRDVLTARTALHGWPIELIDTAGLRESDDPLEAAGVSKAEATLATADLVLAVFDAAAPWTERNADLLKQISPSNHLIVHNKRDLCRSPLGDDRPSGILVSALAREGLDELTEAITASLLRQPIESGDGVPFTTRQIESLEAASAALAMGDASAAADALQTLLTPTAPHRFPG